MHKKNIKTAGKPLKEASKALVMLHGRGGTAQDILRLASHLNVNEYALVAPEATHNTWYPYSFMAPTEQNEPWLSSALDMLKEVVDEVIKYGITADKIYFMGFSQGACLVLEYVARHAQKYAGIAAFTGGLIGNKINRDNYLGSFDNTPVFIGTGNPDSHVPLERVKESVRILEEMGAVVNLKVYDGRQHTVSQDEIEIANKVIFRE